MNYFKVRTISTTYTCISAEIFLKFQSCLTCLLVRWSHWGRWGRWERGGSHLGLGHQVGVTAAAILTHGALLCTRVHAIALTRDHILAGVIAIVIGPVVSIKGQINCVIAWWWTLGLWCCKVQN